MSDLVRKAVHITTYGRLGKKKKQLSSAQRQARKVGAKIGKVSEKARTASEREFAAPSVSSILGGTAGPGLGSSAQNYRRRGLKRSR